MTASPTRTWKLAQETTKPIRFVNILRLEVTLQRGGRIIAARLLAHICFEDGDTWHVEGELRRTVYGFRLIAPERLPSEVYRAIRRKAVAMVCIGEAL